MTPYDVALRVQRREVDGLRLSISVEVSQLGIAENTRIELERTGEEERAVAATLPMASDAWNLRMRAERARMDEAIRLATARLAQLRSQASEAYATVRAIELAAADYRDQRERELAGAEQAASDDMTAAAFLRARRIRSRTA